MSDPFQDDGEREQSDHVRGDTAIFRRYVTRNRSALFQTADGEMAESKMGDKEACLDQKQKRKI